MRRLEIITAGLGAHIAGLCAGLAAEPLPWPENAGRQGQLGAASRRR